MKKTIILEGVEYVLVPKAEYKEDVVIGDLEKSPDTSVLSDFLQQKTNFVENINVNSSKKQSEEEIPVKIVNASQKIGVQVATPKPYTYREKFKKRELSPSDVTGYPTMARNLTADFKDLEIFDLDRQKPANKRLFYGPGLEVDVPGVI